MTMREPAGQGAERVTGTEGASRRAALGTFNLSPRATRTAKAAAISELDSGVVDQVVWPVGEDMCCLYEARQDVSNAHKFGRATVRQGRLSHFARPTVNG
ncbi:hypothetical protein NDU88_002429 [Pleurodeles waltl]|uniref:Uncharacterized protein n=1 Tax=Pleurodeles waltl TaxID=8319 RepID=A0AAV7WL76_PLEWA|nr:hypothetical protein NDU88_002429 [Pleurodeles waltl]